MNAPLNAPLPVATVLDQLDGLVVEHRKTAQAAGSADLLAHTSAWVAYQHAAGLLRDQFGLPRRCNAAVAAVIVVNEFGESLMIRRANEPYGWALPAGHVNAGEAFSLAAARELWEEVGLVVRQEDLVLSVETRVVRTDRPDYHCLWPDGVDTHDWQVFTASSTTGRVDRSTSEVTAAAWLSRDELDRLADRTRRYTASRVSETDWQRSPGIEPAQLGILAQLGRVGGAR